MPRSHALSPDIVEGPPAEARIRHRLPSRGRGVIRYKALLDATEALLQDQDPDEVGLYQIAAKAGVPPASVYHFFPTKGAAFLALAERYIQGFRDLAAEPIEAVRLKSWQDLLAIGQARAAAYYNAHPPALKILLGGHPNWDIRQADLSHNAEIARDGYSYYDDAFHMPHLADPERMFLILVGISDAIWAISFSRHGRITSEFEADALAASIAYCRLFLPDQVEPRAHVREAAASGGLVAVRRASDRTSPR
jgi:AcrR family transcriptional regulator